jgi:mono/diheme cytochrome c family protein
VAGTVARGDELPYHLTNDSAGLNAANALRNPLDTLAVTKGGMLEAERLYLINCGICHGTALDGNGPLYNGGNGPFPVAPRNLTDAYTKGLTDGHIFHVITFGIRTMGSYSSQLRPDQRWWVIKYIRSKQGGGGTGGSDTASKAAPSGTNVAGESMLENKK